MYMEKQDEIAEKIIRQAFENGGEVLFCDTKIGEFEDTQLLKTINLILSMYGKVHGMMISHRWTYYTINENGYRFIKEGGFKGERERENRKNEFEMLTLENTRLQNEASKYQQRVRVWQVVSAILALVISLLAAIRS